MMPHFKKTKRSVGRKSCILMDLQLCLSHYYWRLIKAHSFSEYQSPSPYKVPKIKSWNPDTSKYSKCITIQAEWMLFSRNPHASPSAISPLRSRYTLRNWNFPSSLIWEKEGLRPVPVRGGPCLPKEIPHSSDSLSGRLSGELGAQTVMADRTAPWWDGVMHTSCLLFRPRSLVCIPKLDFGQQRIHWSASPFTVGILNNCFSPPPPWLKMSF